mgnify:FL=1
MKTFMRDKMGDVRPNMQKRCTFSMWLIVASNQMAFVSSRIACKPLKKYYVILGQVSYDTLQSIT